MCNQHVFAQHVDAGEAIMTVTGSRAGRRRLRIVDNGKMAATFRNLETGVAFRLFSQPDISAIEQIFCRPCATGTTYYTALEPFTEPVAEAVSQ
jgi:hypothetical protein